MGTWLARHRKAVVFVWIAISIGLSVGGRIADGQPSTSFNLPGSESQQALDLLEEAFPALTDASVTVVYQVESGTIDDSTNAPLIDKTVKALGGLDQVSKVSSPTQIPDKFFDVSSSKTIAYSTVSYDTSLTDVSTSAFADLVGAVTPARDAGMNVDIDGALVDNQNPPTGGLSDYADLISIIVAILIITLAFGAPIVSLMPIVVALAALSVSLSTLSFIENWTAISAIDEVLGTMLALGVGIDYSLLIINRHRQLRADGRSVLDSIGGSSSTAGVSVVLAGTTVCVATCALAVVGVPMVTKLGLTAAMFVAFTVLAALTLLPALLGFAGENLDRWGLPWVESKSKFWPSWAATNKRFRWPLAIVPLLVLGLAFFAVPSADLGIIDDGSLPTSLTQRRAFDNIATGFGVGANGPLLIVGEIPEGADKKEVIDATQSLVKTLKATDGVASASPPRFGGPSGSALNTIIESEEAAVLGESAPTTTPSAETTAPSTTVAPTTTTPSPTTTVAGSATLADIDTFVLRVVPSSSPDAKATTALVDNLRSTVIETALAGTVIVSSDVYVGGQTAVLIDFTDRVAERLPLYIGIVLLLAMLLLMSAFRSVLIPVKAAVMALVSFLAAYGATIAIFQWGWMKDVVGLTDTVPIQTFFPLMLFAILFGLSMDYEVFLISRVREEYEDSGEARPAAIAGLSTTGKIILSAGLIMTSVFVAFATNPSPAVKQMALGLAIAIAIDALIIRLIVVPALLQIFGKSAWWLPKWIDRILPRIKVS